MYLESALAVSKYGSLESSVSFHGPILPFSFHVVLTKKVLTKATLKACSRMPFFTCVTAGNTAEVTSQVTSHRSDKCFLFIGCMLKCMSM